MKITPGFVGSLKEELQGVLPEYQQRVHRDGGLMDAELVSLTTRFDADPAAYHPEQVDIGNISTYEHITEEHVSIGDAAIKNGEVAFCLLAGGAGTRMGGPKLFARIPGIGISLLAWKLMQAGGMPVWVMTPPGMVKPIEQHISHLVLAPGMSGVVFEQFEGYRLTPDNRLSMLAPGTPDLYPLGHGDVGPALVENGVLDDNPNVKHVIVCNVDNVLASPHSGILGHHILNNAAVTCEIVDRAKTDHGGVLAWVNGFRQIAEDFRLPDGFVEQAKFHNTNTMIIDTSMLRANIPWRWHRVRKHADSRLFIQHERLLQQYTEHCTADYVHVPRQARYMPVKTNDDLDRAGNALAAFHFKP